MNTNIYNLIILFLVLLTFSCENDDLRSEVGFSEIEKGALYGNGEEGIQKSNLVISSSTEWENLIRKMDSKNNVSNGFTETEIDFDNFLIIAIFLEVKPRGWEVEITNIIENENSLSVSTTESEFSTLVITQPFHIVKIPAIDKAIRFE